MIATGSLRQKLLDLAVSGKLVPRTGEWRTVPLEEIANVQLGKMLDKAKNTGKPFRYLANINVRWREFDLSDLKETLFDEKDIGKFSLSKGDLLMCEGGEPGRCAVWEEVDSDIKYQKAIHRIRCSACVSPYFLQIYFEAIAGKAFFTQRFTGSTIHHLPREVLLSTPIPLPPLEEQKRIVARLEELLALEREIAADGAALDDLVAAARRKILDLAVSGKLVPRQGEWRTVKLGDAVDGFQYGTAQKSCKEGAVPVLRMGNLKNGEIDWTNLVFSSDASDNVKYDLHAGDLLFNRTNSADKVGKTSIYRGERKAIFAGYLVRMRPLSGIADSEYLNFFMNSRPAWEFCQSVKSDAVCQSNISASKIANLPVPLPTLAEQKAIVKRVDELMALLDAMKG